MEAGMMAGLGGIGGRCEVSGQGAEGEDMGLGGRGNRQIPGGGTRDCAELRGGGPNCCMRSMVGGTIACV